MTNLSIHGFLAGDRSSLTRKPDNNFCYFRIEPQKNTFRHTNYVEISFEQALQSLKTVLRIQSEEGAAAILESKRVQ
jgi:hypothetical protein